jgi:hypothetical protein
MTQLDVLPCLDSRQMAAAQQRELHISRAVAAALGRSAVAAAHGGRYITEAGQKVEWRDAVQESCVAKVSIPADTPLQRHERRVFTDTRVQVTNETTLGAARRLVVHGLRPLALNFANGIHPGGGFLQGAASAGGGAVSLQRALSDPRGRYDACGALQAPTTGFDGLGHLFPRRARLSHG